MFVIFKYYHGLTSVFRRAKRKSVTFCVPNFNGNLIFQILFLSMYVINVMLRKYYMCAILCKMKYVFGIMPVLFWGHKCN